MWNLLALSVVLMSGGGQPQIEVIASSVVTTVPADAHDLAVLGRAQVALVGKKSIYVVSGQPAAVHTHPVPGTVLQFTGGGKRVAYATKKQAVLLEWNGSAFKEVWRFDPPGKRGDLALDEDGRLLAIGTSSGVTLWDVSEKKKLRTLPESSLQGTLHLAFSGGIVAAGAGKTLKIWDAETGAKVLERRKLDGIELVQVQQDGGRVYASSKHSAYTMIPNWKRKPEWKISENMADRGGPSWRVVTPEGVMRGYARENEAKVRASYHGTTVNSITLSYRHERESGVIRLRVPTTTGFREVLTTANGIWLLDNDLRVVFVRAEDIRDPERRVQRAVVVAAGDTRQRKKGRRKTPPSQLSDAAVKEIVENAARELFQARIRLSGTAEITRASSNRDYWSQVCGADQDQSHSVDEQEFVTWTTADASEKKELTRKSEQPYRAQFKEVERTGDSKLTLDDFKESADLMGAQKVWSVLKNADLDNDGAITEAEWIEFSVFGPAR